jgi:hypothetical protein
MTALEQRQRELILIYKKYANYSSPYIKQLESEIAELEKQAITDADIEAWARITPTCRIDKVWTLEVDIRYREGLTDGAKAVLNGEI